MRRPPRRLAEEPATDAEPDPVELRASIDAVFAKARRARSPYGVAKDLAAMLSPCLESLELMIARGRAVEAEPLLKRIVAASERAVGRIDDSHARFYPLCAHAVMLWGRAWSQIEPRNRRKLAEMVRKFVAEGDLSIRDRMIEHFAEALGEEGLAALRERYRADLDALPPPSPAKHAALSPDWHVRSTIVWNLQSIADAQGDVEEFIELCRIGGRLDHEGIAIGRRLVEAGRHDEALAWVDRAILADPDGDPRRPYDEPYDAASVRAMALRGLGRIDEAAETLWQEFARRPSAATLRAIDEGAAADPAGNAPAEDTLERAISTVSQHCDPHSALLFLLEIGATTAAAALTLARSVELDGRDYGVLLRLARSLAKSPESTHAHAAWIAYGQMLSAILAAGRRTAYGHAADHLVRMRAIASRAGLAAEQQAFDAELADRHRLKRAFWEAVEREGRRPKR